MKTLKNKRHFMSGLCLVMILYISGCTDLEEETFGILSPDNYYNTEAEALSSVVGVYQRLATVADGGDSWRIAEMETDEFILPGRSSGGWFDEDNVDLKTHDVKPTSQAIARSWQSIFQVIGTANAVLESLEASPNSENLSSLIAETRALRAYGYFYAMDFWGNVPIVTEARIDPLNLPTNSSRTEVFEFIESELLLAIPELPSVKEVDRSNYYPRFTKESYYALLATMYLNSEVYTGTPQWEMAIEMSNNIINTGAFSLEENVVDNFTSPNQLTSTEIISSFSIDPARNAGNNEFIRRALHPLHQLKYDFPFSPANGYNTTQEAVERYEDQDERKDLLVYGPQTYLNGDPLLDSDGEQLVLIPVQSLYSAEENEGYRVLKYNPIGATFSGRYSDNDFVIVRYSDILLIKAEALFRTGNHSEALNLINQVRSRSGASALDNLTLKDIENERARELIWEGYRRRDMIRFGSFFNETWSFKTSKTEEFRAIFPIPQEQIITNPNLVQNPGY